MLVFGYSENCTCILSVCRRIGLSLYATCKRPHDPLLLISKWNEMTWTRTRIVGPYSSLLLVPKLVSTRMKMVRFPYKSRIYDVVDTGSAFCIIISYLAQDDFRSEIFRRPTQSPGSSADSLRKAEISYLNKLKTCDISRCRRVYDICGRSDELFIMIIHCYGRRCPSLYRLLWPKGHALCIADCLTVRSSVSLSRTGQ